MSDPFRLLGLDRSRATADDVRRARRELAKEAHPDVGGTAGRMQELNAWAASALAELAGVARPGTSRPGADGSGTGRDGAAGRDGTAGGRAPTPPWTAGERPSRDGSDGRRTDTPSFTVEALPVETFEALLVVVSVLGELVDDDPPYELAALLDEPTRCWCRMYVVPDAGASTVSVAIGPVEGHPMPAIETVRDAWIAELNRLDWDQLS